MVDTEHPSPNEAGSQHGIGSLPNWIGKERRPSLAPRTRSLPNPAFAAILAIIPIAVAFILLVCSFCLTGHFTKNPQLQARLQDATLTKDKHYGSVYRIASSEFICAGTTNWGLVAGGLMRRETTKTAIFRVFLEESSQEGWNAQDGGSNGTIRTRTGPVYVEVADVFGVSLEIRTIEMSSLQLAWLEAQRCVLSGVFRVLAIVFLVGYVLFVARRYHVRNFARGSQKADTQQGASGTGEQPKPAGERL